MSSGSASPRWMACALATRVSETCRSRATIVRVRPRNWKPSSLSRTSSASTRRASWARSAEVLARLLALP